MTRGSSIRLFAALLPPPECTEALAGWARSELAGPGRRLLAPDMMHLTMSFLGERPVPELATLTAALAEIDAKAPELGLGAPVFLPPRQPRTVAVEVTDDSGSLAELQRRTADALEAASSWQPPKRRFRPHITVARLRRDSVVEGVPGATPPLTFRPVALELLRSHLLPEGAVYEALATKLLYDGDECLDGPSSIRLAR